MARRLYLDSLHAFYLLFDALVLECGEWVNAVKMTTAAFELDTIDDKMTTTQTHRWNKHVEPICKETKEKKIWYDYIEIWSVLFLLAMQ